MDATSFAQRLVGTHEEFGRPCVEFAEEEPVAVDGLAEQLDGGGRSQVGVGPCAQLPHQVPVLVDFHGLYGSVKRVHRCLVPLVVPVVDDMASVFQAQGFLWLCHPIFCGVHLPYGLSHAGNLLDVTFAAGDEQVAFGQFLHRPWQKTGPAVHFTSVAVVLVDASQRHVGHEECAARRQACVAELSVHRPFL